MRSRILKAIKDNISSKVWKTWFSSFDISNVEGRTVIFRVANPFIKDWLEKRYGKIILKSVRSVLGQDASFEIVFVEPSEPPPPNEGPLVRRKPVVLSELNPHFTFDTFVVGNSNEFAYSAAMEVAMKPGRFNPFFIYGGVGLGKTHLAQAIAHETLKRWPELRVIYVTSEEFMNQMIESIKAGDIQTFRERFRKKVDVLIIDDVQFLEDKPGIRNELFHTFNYLHNQGKQLVFCSDRDPTELTGFHERLISRFKMGLVVEVGIPDFKTRLEVTKRFVQQEGLELDEKQLMKIANSPGFNFRHVKGLITRLAFRTKMMGDYEDINAILEEILKGVPTRTGTFEDALLREAVSAVASMLKVTEEELMGKSKRLSKYRASLCFALAKIGGYPLKDLSSTFKRSKSTLSYLVKRGEGYSKRDAMAKAVVELVESVLNARKSGQLDSAG